MSTYSLRSLVENNHVTMKKINGKWVPARPINGTIKERILSSWLVLIGKADAFTWPEGQ